MTTVPSVSDWQTNPAGALASALAIAQATTADAGMTGGAIALGILAQIGQAALPLVGAALPGPEGAIATASLSLLLTSLQNARAQAAASLTPEQQNIIATTIQIGTAAIIAKNPPKG